MRGLAVGLLLLCSCAALNTLGMSEHCKVAYNACLNGCPDASRAGSPTPPLAATTRGSTDMNTEVASCTAACNSQADRCK